MLSKPWGTTKKCGEKSKETVTLTAQHDEVMQWVMQNIAKHVLDSIDKLSPTDEKSTYNINLYNRKHYEVTLFYSDGMLTEMHYEDCTKGNRYRIIVKK